MKKMLVKTKSSIYLKLLLSFIIIILPMYFIGLAINITSNNYAKNDIMNFQNMQVQYYIETFENEIKKAISLQRDFSTDPDLLRLSTLSTKTSNYDNVVSMEKVHTMLSIIKNSCSFIEDVEVSIPSIKKKISFNNQIDELDIREYTETKNAFAANYSRILNRNRMYLINMYYPYVSFDEDPMYVFSIHLSESMMKKAMDGFLKYEKSGALVISSNYNWYISNKRDSDMEIDGIISQIETIDFGGQASVQKEATFDGKEYLLTYKKSNYLDMIFILYVPQDQIFGTLYKYKIWLISISAFSLIVVILFSYWMYGLIKRPLDAFMKAFRCLEDGDMTVNINRDSNDEFKYLYDQFNKTVANLKILISEVYEQKIHAQKAELKQLQYQINPHFLYNTIYIIYRMAKKQDYDNILKLSKHLGDYYRNVVRSALEDIILETEINHIKDYIEIQNIRFEGRIKAIVNDLPQNYRSIMVPRLIIQPVVENAYEHGLKNKFCDGIIDISFYQDDNNTYIFVEDNGDETSDEQIYALQNALLSNDHSMENTGLINIHKRLQIKYGDKSGIAVSRSKLGGIKIEISIID